MSDPKEIRSINDIDFKFCPFLSKTFLLPAAPPAGKLLSPGTPAPMAFMTQIFPQPCSPKCILYTDTGCVFMAEHFKRFAEPKQ